ncbi:MAG: hypothetical protein ABW101_15980 [Candidatus Thiodiazotropha sp.]
MNDANGQVHPKPLALKGANYVTHTLETGPDVWRYRPSGTLTLVCRLIGWLGGAILVLLTIPPVLFYDAQPGVTLLLILLGLGIGRLLFYLRGRCLSRAAIAPSFNLKSRTVELPVSPMFKQRLGVDLQVETLRFDQLASLQLLSKWVILHNGGNFASYELNLVLQDGRRFNLVDHHDEKRIRSEARRLSKRLDLPLSDFTNR